MKTEGRITVFEPEAEAPRQLGRGPTVLRILRTTYEGPAGANTRQGLNEIDAYFDLDVHDRKDLVRCLQVTEKFVAIPIDLYVEEGEATLPMIADALAAGRYEDAIVIYLEKHWHKVQELVALQERE